jgi:serine/threonine-protein kinase RsbW
MDSPAGKQAGAFARMRSVSQTQHGDSEADEAEVRIVMASKRRAIPKTVEKVLRAVKPVGLPSERLEDLAVAVSEALSNAAIHGNQLNPESQVVVTVRVRPHVRAVIEVKDDGPGFEAEHLHDPTDPNRLLATGGRGVFLMRRLVDEVEYVDGGSRVRLTVGKALRTG